MLSKPRPTNCKSKKQKTTIPLFMDYSLGFGFSTDPSTPNTSEITLEYLLIKLSRWEAMGTRQLVATNSLNSECTSMESTGLFKPMIIKPLILILKFATKDSWQWLSTRSAIRIRCLSRPARSPTDPKSSSQTWKITAPSKFQSMLMQALGIPFQFSRS